MENIKHRKRVYLAWRAVSTQACSSEEFSAADVQVKGEGIAVQESVITGGKMGTSLGTYSTSFPNKHAVSVNVGSSLMRFIKGFGGSTQKKLEDDLDVKIIFPPTRTEDHLMIEGKSGEAVSKALEKIQVIIEEAVESPRLDYSHFVSLPLAVHPELVDKLFKFQNSILESGSSLEDDDSSEDNNPEVKDGKQQLSNLEAKLKDQDGSEQVVVNTGSISIVSYPPKASKSSSSSSLGIDKSIFIRPRTIHLTVLMLKLWNKDRVSSACEVLKSVSSEVKDALENRPVSIRLKGLECMKGSVAKARVVYVPVEEIGNEGRLLRACQVITDAFIKAGLVLERDATHTLKLHATVMNVRHGKSSSSKKFYSFDARGVFKEYGSEDWGGYNIPEAHLSERFAFDENGYYHCCASIPFPEPMQTD
ncbi:hypothetical protein MLD38_007932 [Melastoma candidum]|nr:hypothetical protein MLD38_007932 [Melastoma candidum]